MAPTMASSNERSKKSLVSMKKIETICDKFAVSRFSPATFGWRTPISEERGRFFSKTKLYEETWECTDAKKILMLQLRRLLSTTFPYILPERYHDMECKSLLDSSSNGHHQYLQNASQFVFFSQVYGVGYWSYLETLVDKAFNDSKLISQVPQQFFHKSSRQFSAFENPAVDLHQSKSPQKFLTNPWVIMQLPWHAALFNQWLVVALAEFYRLHGQVLVEFCNWPVPLRLTEIVYQLINKLDKLHLLVMTGFRLIGLQVSNWPNCDSRLPGHILQSVVLPTLEILQFFLNPEIISAIDSIKHLAWPPQANEELRSYQGLGSTCAGSDESIYGIDFCSSLEKFGPFFGRTNDTLDSVLGALHNFTPTSPKVCRSGQKIQLEFDLECSNLVFIEVWNKHQQLIKMHSTDVVEKRLIFKEKGAKIEIPWEKARPMLSSNYDFPLTHLNILKGLDKAEFGAINDIYLLEMEASSSAFEVCLANDLQILFKSNGVETYLCPNLPKGFKPRTLAQAELILRKGEDLKWTLKTLKEQFSAEVKDQLVCCPELKSSYTPEDCSQAKAHYEMRIKKLVYYMFEECQKAAVTEDTAFVFPEWQFVQYLLPCFVALIGNLSKQTELERYTKVVLSLIQSYETHLEKKPLLEQKSNEKTPSWLLKNMIALLHAKFDTVLGDLGLLVHGTRCKSNGLVHTLLANNAFSFFLDSVEVIQKSPNLKSSEDLDNLLIEHCLQVEKFLCRLNTCIQKVELAIENPSSQGAINFLQVLLVLQELHDVASLSQENYVIEDSVMVIFEYVDFKIKSSLLGIQEEQAPKFQAGNKKKKVLAEVKNLSVQQMLGILLYHCVLQLKNCQPQFRNRFLQEDQVANSQLVNKAFAICKKQRWQKLKLMLTPLLCDEKGTDLSLVTLDFARMWPLSYKTILSKFETCIKSDKRMERQVFPLLYCRSCNKFDTKLTKCQHCEGLNIDEFPDVQWFCSLKCENKALEAGHEIEHSQYLMKKLGLNEQ